MTFNLGAGQDFMPGLGLRDAGALPSGADRLAWQPAAQATGYALAMFGAAQNGDVIMWSSGKGMPALDYLTPSEVKRLIAAGQVLAPTTSQCLLPAEVAAASPAGMVTMIGYGPEADFSDNPKAPNWVGEGPLQDDGLADPRHGRDGREHESRRRPGRSTAAAAATAQEAEGLRSRRDPRRRRADPALGSRGSPLVEN